MISNLTARPDNICQAGDSRRMSRIMNPDLVNLMQVPLNMCRLESFAAVCAHFFNWFLLLCCVPYLLVLTGDVLWLDSTVPIYLMCRFSRALCRHLFIFLFLFLFSLLLFFIYYYLFIIITPSRHFCRHFCRTYLSPFLPPFLIPSQVPIAKRGGDSWLRFNHGFTCGSVTSHDNREKPLIPSVWGGRDWW